MTNKSNDDQLVLLKRAYAYEKAKDSVDVDEAWKEFEIGRASCRERV